MNRDSDASVGGGSVAASPHCVGAVLGREENEPFVEMAAPDGSPDLTRAGRWRSLQNEQRVRELIGSDPNVIAAIDIL